MIDRTTKELNGGCTVVAFMRPKSEDAIDVDHLLEDYNQLSRIVMNALSIANAAEQQRAALARQINERNLRCQHG